MLLAEIHGKTFAEIENNEDWLTSAVFGHLRFLPLSLFWPSFFARCRTAEPEVESLTAILRSKGIELANYRFADWKFWPNGQSYGEPDILLRLHDTNQPVVLVAIEVKLNSGKSGTGKDDQLAKYLRLLDDSARSIGWPASHTFLIYLTRHGTEDDLLQSAAAYELASGRERLFGIYWTDVLDIAQQERDSSPILSEVADFLYRRDYGKFQGFTPVEDHLFFRTGAFYQTRYFNSKLYEWNGKLGLFYGK